MGGNDAAEIILRAKMVSPDLASHKIDMYNSKLEGGTTQTLQTNIVGLKGSLSGLDNMRIRRK